MEPHPYFLLARPVKEYHGGFHLNIILQKPFTTGIK